jgi:hypothetical protein
MKALAKRRSRNLLGTCIVFAVSMFVYWISQATLIPRGGWSGWILCVLILFLAAYQVRKALPVLPLGSSAAWLQAHIYAGLATAVLFAIHLDFALPNGHVEGLLATVYGLVFCSGLVGLFMTRRFPIRLRHLSSEVLFEQIPVERRQIVNRANQLILQAQSNTTHAGISDIYRSRIYPFLNKPRGILWHVLGQDDRTARRLIQSLNDQRRYLTKDSDIELLKNLEQAIRGKSELDVHTALQGTLKLWLFVHIPATTALLVFMVLHILLVYAWSGGTR